ncbi:hypothetical protein CHUAL_002270 [Chamberlinius hualienensis]
MRQIILCTLLFCSTTGKINVSANCTVCNYGDLVMNNCEVHLVNNYSNFQVLCNLYVATSIFENADRRISGLKMKIMYKSSTTISVTSNDQSKKNVNLTVVRTEAETVWSKRNNFIFYSINDTNCATDETYTESLKLSVRYDGLTSVGDISYNPICILKEIKNQISNSNDVKVTSCIDRITTLDIAKIQLEIFILINCELQNSKYASVSSSNVCECNRQVTNICHLSWVLKSLRIMFSADNINVINKKKFFSKMSELKVEDVDLHGNSLKYFHNALIPQIRTLEKLDLSWCEINAISSWAFIGLSNLTYLNLAGNSLSDIPRAILNMTRLQTLNLSFNFPTKPYYGDAFHLQIDRLVQLQSLKVIDISRMKMKIDNSKPQVFPMENMQSLNASGTSINSFPDIFTEIFPYLEEIILSDNSFTSQSVASLIESKWSQLKLLDLSHQYNAGIREVNLNRMLSNCPQLKFLNLVNNSISTISNVSNVLHRSFNLNLSSNNIEFWTNEMFHMNYSQQPFVIDLSNNNINEVSLAMLKDFDKFSSVYLSGNPFNCSKCQLQSFQRWLKGQSVDSKVRNIKCTYPSTFADYMVTEVNFDSYECLNKVVYWMLNAVIPTIVTAISIIAIVYLLFRFHWHFRYCFYMSKTNFKILRQNNVELNTLSNHHWDAFISYCADDNDWVVQHLIQSLEDTEPKLHLCLHERDFLIGDSIVNNVIQCIDVSRKSVFLLTNKFLKSQWCQWELQIAQHKLFEDKTDVLVLIVLEDLVVSEIPLLLKKLMATKTYLKWPNSNNDIEIKIFWTRMRQFIGPCHCTQRLIEEHNNQIH